MEKELIKYFLPKDILSHYIITKVSEILDKESQAAVLRIELEEINKIPEGYDASQYESKGFYSIKEIQDYPIRDKAVLLAVKRRRWRNKKNKDEEIHSAYTFIAEGARITQDLSDFLKEGD
jgi:hypothetical protein